MTVISRGTDAMLNSEATKGLWRRYLVGKKAASTAATSTSGYTTCGRIPMNLSIPTMGTGITDAYITLARGVTSATTAGTIIGLEYLLGSIDLSTGTFTDNVAMPTKVIEGLSVQTAASIVFMAIRTSLTATTPVITITYTDQDGNTGNSCALTLPTNALIDSAFYCYPHFASGDTGIRDITNITKSAGTVGIIDVYGILPISIGANAQTALVGSIDPLVSPLPMPPCIAGDKLGFYVTGIESACDFHAVISAVADF